ncbi:hypothetical protein KDU71_15965 [Carboxylicivirga sediminis]|uniref:DUF1080 domain-containing protein n=1 Tax=Carboxylicivirga sediminis TaxID=2006564 RepID=A0A941F607_9BACT|nr:hypothetical protein [Carboxylicivirga sediminis]MBR8537069.1 hypothetical protein [Carboxylicivirga sediminis]
MKQLLLTSIIVFCLVMVASGQTDTYKDYKVVYSQGFNKESSTSDFEFSDASKWLISKNGKPGKTLKCLGKGDYENMHEGPSVVAVLKDYELKDFVVEMDVVQNGKDFSLLDFCIFFDIKDKNNYCYAQIASKADKKSHNVFAVSSDRPKRIGTVYEEGIIWQMNEWQHIRMERNTSAKSIKVYFDGELVLEVADDMSAGGHIGFGSSHSALKIDNFKVSAPFFESNTKTIF